MQDCQQKRRVFFYNSAATLDANGANMKAGALWDVDLSRKECSNNNRGASARHDSQGRLSHRTPTKFLKQRGCWIQEGTVLLPEPSAALCFLTGESRHLFFFSVQGNGTLRCWQLFNSQSPEWRFDLIASLYYFEYFRFPWLASVLGVEEVLFNVIRQHVSYPLLYVFSKWETSWSGKHSKLTDAAPAMRAHRRYRPWDFRLCDLFDVRRLQDGAAAWFQLKNKSGRSIGDLKIVRRALGRPRRRQPLRDIFS